MTKKAFATAMLIVAAVCAAAFALPTIKITTSDGKIPDGTRVSQMDMTPSYNFKYVSMSKFELIIDPDNERANMTRNVSADSVRQRGNSTAHTDMPKKPYRIKFDQKVSLFGKPAAKSWVLLANHMDKTFAMNALAFRLGQIIGLEFTPSFQFVNLEICNQSGTCAKKGIYQLTEQTQVGEGRVDIDEDKGWLVEFNFHPADNNDIKFTSSKYSLDVFIKSPEIDDADYKGSSVSSYPQLTFVRDEFNKIMDTLADNTKFQAGTHRDMIDLSSYAKYVFIQQFMANFEWTELGYVGSNFTYKNVGDRMKAGPLWDFDLATGKVSGAYSFFQNATKSILPHEAGRHAFYRRLVADEVFRARYRKLWDDHKTQIQALAANGGFIDSIAGVLRSHIEANYKPYESWNAPSSCFVGCGVKGSGPQTASDYDTEITKLKNWWNTRYNHWNGKITSSETMGNQTYTFDASKDVPDKQLPAQRAIKVGRTPNAGGTVTLKIGSGSTITDPDGNNYAAEGTSVTITSSTNSGYTFKGWTAVNGTSLPSGIDANSNSITFTVGSGNIDIKANYESGMSSISGASHGKFANGSRVAVVKDGLRLNAVDKVIVKIYGLDGRQVRRVDLASGNHTVRFVDMPKGLYMARVSVDGQVRTLRVPVR